MRTKLVTGLAVTAALVVFATALDAQDVPELVARYGDIDAPALVGVVDVAEQGGAAAVLTRPDPALHIFEGRQVVEFGRSGGGPSELQTPVDLAWRDSTLIVLDVNQKKFVGFRPDGSAAYSRSLGSDWARRLFIEGSDTILGTFVPMSDERAIVRLRSGAQDTIYRYAVRGRKIRLRASGSPSLTLSAPFTPQVEWTVLKGGSIAVWDPGVGRIKLLNTDGAHVGVVDVPNRSWSVSAADREQWLADKIPSEFMGRRGIFEPLRREAAREVDFPDTFPPVLQLLGDPSGAVWVRKTTAGSGEVWAMLNPKGRELGILRLPPGRSALHIGSRGIYASWGDDLGVEYVEMYRRPLWADS